jgi:hypothetical protein
LRSGINCNRRFASKGGASMTRPSFAPLKPCDPELPKAAVRRLFSQAGGIKRVAVRLGIKEPTVYALADPGVDDEISFARVAALTGPESPAAVEYLAGLAGGVFQAILAQGACADGQGDVQALTAESARQHGEAIAAVVTALADDRIDAREARAALVELEQAIAAACGLRGRLLEIIGRE